MAAQSPPKMWSCDLCGKTFQGRLSRAQHRRVHSRFRPFICVFGVCTKSFSTLSEFQQHQRHHHDHRPHYCARCGRRFITRKHLALHNCSRRNSQRHKCHRCTASFTQVMALSKHIRHEHGKMRKILRTGGQGTKTKFKCVASDGKLKIMNIEAGQNRTNLTEDSDKDDNKILLKITAGKSTTIISPCKSSHTDSRKRLKKSKKKHKRPKESRKNGIILSIKNGSVKLPEIKLSVPKSNPVQNKDNFSADFEPVKQWNNLKLKIRTYPELTVSAKDTNTMKDSGALAASSQTAVLKEETTVNISNVEQTNILESGNEKSPSQNISADSKVRNGIVIHKDRSGKLLAEQLHKANKAKTRKRDNVFDSFSDIGIWKVLPSPRTDSPSDVLKLKLSPQKPLRVEPAVCFPMENSTSKYFETSLKTKMDQSGDDSDVFGTSPITDKEDGGLHNVNDSGIEVLSSSSCNRSNGNSVHSVVLDENSPTYFIAGDSPLSLDSPVMEPLNKVEHSICHKCGGIIVETNNNTRSPGNCNCIFSNPNSPFPIHASPASRTIIPVIDVEANKSFDEKMSSVLGTTLCKIEPQPVIEKGLKDVQSKTFVDKKAPLTVVIDDDDVITASNVDCSANIDKFESGMGGLSSRLKLRPRKSSVSPNKKSKSDEKSKEKADEKSKEKRKKNEKSNPCFRELFKPKDSALNVSPVVIIDDDESDGQENDVKTSSAASKGITTDAESEKPSLKSPNKKPLFRVKKNSLTSPTLKSSSAVTTSIQSKQVQEIHTSEISNYRSTLPTTEEANVHEKPELPGQVGKSGDNCKSSNMDKIIEMVSKGLTEDKSIIECLEQRLETDVGTCEHKDVVKKKPLFRRHTKSCENKEMDCDKNSDSPLKRKAHSLSHTTDISSSGLTKQLEKEDVLFNSDISVIEKKDLSQMNSNKMSNPPLKTKAHSGSHASDIPQSKSAKQMEKEGKFTEVLFNSDISVIEKKDLSQEMDCDKSSKSPLKRTAHSLSHTTDIPPSETTKQTENNAKLTEALSNSDLSVVEKKEKLSQEMDSNKKSNSPSKRKAHSLSHKTAIPPTSTKQLESKEKLTEGLFSSDLSVVEKKDMSQEMNCDKKSNVPLKRKAQSLSPSKSSKQLEKENKLTEVSFSSGLSVIENKEDLSQPSEECSKPKVSKLSSSERVSASDSLNKKISSSSGNRLDCMANESKAKSFEKKKASDVAVKNKRLKDISVFSEADNDDSLQQLQDIDDDIKPEASKPASGTTDFGLFQQQFLSFLSCNNPVPKEQDSNKTAKVKKSETKSKKAAKGRGDKNKKCDISKNSFPSENKKSDSMSWLKIFSPDDGYNNEERKGDETSKDDIEFTDDLAAINKKMDISDDDDSNSLDMDDVFDSKHLSFLEPKQSTTSTNLKRLCTSEMKTEAKVPPRRPQTAKRSKIPCKVSSRRLSKIKNRVNHDSDDSDDSSTADTWDHVSIYTANSDTDPDFNPFNDSDDDFVAAPIKRRHSIERRSKSSRVNYDSLVDDGNSKDSCNDDAESHISRSRRASQMRKSMCPCCIGSPEKKQEHHTHRKQMYRLPKGYKQFIKSTVKLKELQEKIIQLFLSLFPDCADIFSQCKIGTDEFDVVMDAVLSDLEKEDIPFEQECSISNNCVSNSIILPVSSELTVFPAAVPFNETLDFSTQGIGLEALADIKGLDCTSGPESIVDKTIMNDNNVETQLDAKVMSPCEIAQLKTQSVSCAPVENNEKCNNTVNDTQVEHVSNESVEFQMDPNNVSFISENSDLLTVKSDPMLSVVPPQVPTSSAYCASPLLDELSCSASSSIAVALSDMTADDIAIPACEQVPFEDESVLPFESVVQSDLVITIDLNAAKVPLCREPKACLQQLQTKLSKLVQYLLPEVEFKNYFYRNLDNLEFLLDMMIKANSNSADLHVVKDDNCGLEDDIPVVGDVTGTECEAKVKKLENRTSIEKATVQEETSSEEKIPAFSGCPEQFEQEIKLRRESLKKHVFVREEEPEDTYQTTDVISCIQSLRKIARKKPMRTRRRSDAERRTLFVQEKLQNSHNSTIVCHTNSRSLFSDLEIRTGQKSSHPENSKEKFLSDLNLGGSQENENNDKSLVAIDKCIEEEPEAESLSEEKAENEQLEKEQTDSDDCGDRSRRKSGDKNIFELMQPPPAETSVV